MAEHALSHREALFGDLGMFELGTPPHRTRPVVVGGFCAHDEGRMSGMALSPLGLVVGVYGPRMQTTLLAATDCRGLAELEEV